MVKIAATSDLHGYLPNIEEVDILLICGDILPLDIQVNMPKSLQWLEYSFKPWAEALKCDQVVFIAGNHKITNFDYYCLET